MQKTQRSLQALSWLLFLNAVLLTACILTYSPYDRAFLGRTPSTFLTAQVGISNLLGNLGVLIADVFVAKGLGYFAVSLPLLLAYWGAAARSAKWRTRLAARTLVLSVVALAVPVLVALFGVPYAGFLAAWVGELGMGAAAYLGSLLGTAGAGAVLGTSLVVVAMIWD